MKKAIILHGTGDNENSYWLPWLKLELEAEGYSVFLPSMPEPDKADLTIWTPFLQENAVFDEETVIITHSAGGPLALNILNKIDTPIKKLVMVAGFVNPIPGLAEDDPVYPKNIDWKKVKNNCKEFYFINSDNDPWGCDHNQGEFMRQKLGGTLIVKTGEGHFGSNSFNQPYKKFPLIKHLCIM